MSNASRFFFTFLVALVAAFAPGSSTQASPAPQVSEQHVFEYAAAAPGYTVDREDAAVEGNTTDILYTDLAPKNWQDMLPAAIQAWGGQVPDCQTVTMATFSTDLTRVGAKAGLGGCTMWINVENFKRYYSDHDRCILVAHEYGHLLGKPHGPGLMAGDESIYQANVPACKALRDAEVARNLAAGRDANGGRILPDRTLKKLTFKRAERIVNDWYKGKWEVTSCKRVKRYVVDCKATHVKDNRRHLFTVQISPDGYNTAIA